MKMEQRAAMNSVSTNIRDLRQGRVSINDIKWDLIKIIEPYDGVLAPNEGSEQTVRRLFIRYMSDLKYAGLVNDFNVHSSIRSNAVTFDVSVKMSQERSDKKLKIHVGVYQNRAA
jgi:hypothetical protein|tara:strand:- start:7699 stop:8043 length:345 start_codon:yes stop_codon:yes gene_type:complete